MISTMPAPSDKAEALRRTFDLSFADVRGTDTRRLDDLLAILVGTEPYALRFHEIAGLFADRRITPVPSRIPELLGIAGFRGALIPVYDLRALLGCSITSPPRWLALASGVAIAVAFDGMDGHVRVERDTVASSESGGQSGRYVREVVRASDRIRPIVHIPSVLDAIRELAARGTSQKEN